MALTWLAHQDCWLVEAAAAVSSSHKSSSGPTLAERGAQAALWGGAPHPCGQLAMAQPCKEEAGLLELCAPVQHSVSVYTANMSPCCR